MEGFYAAPEREKLIQHIAEQDAQIKALEDQGLVLLQRVARAESDLLKYGQHEENCTHEFLAGPCDCGYLEALSGTKPYETQKTITKWAVDTFGKPPSIAHLFDRAEDEFYELKEAIASGNPEKIAEETADVRILLSQIAEHLGYDYQAAVDAKMKVNRSRKWDTDGNGSGQHID